MGQGKGQGGVSPVVCSVFPDTNIQLQRQGNVKATSRRVWLEKRRSYCTETSLTCWQAGTLLTRIPRAPGARPGDSTRRSGNMISGCARHGCVIHSSCAISHNPQRGVPCRIPLPQKQFHRATAINGSTTGDPGALNPPHR